MKSLKSTQAADGVLIRDPLSKRLKKDWKKNKGLYFLFLPVLAYYIIFQYGPMAGLLIAFQNYKPIKGVFGSKWVGLKNFKDFFESYYFWRVLRLPLALTSRRFISGLKLVAKA